MTTTTLLLPAESALQFSLPGLQFTAMASPSRGSAQLCTWRLTVSAGLTSPTGHTLDRDEVFMVTSGSLRIRDGLPIAGPGDTVVVPAGELIQVSNPGPVEATAYVAVPAGFSPRTEEGTVIDTPPWAV